MKPNVLEIRDFRGTKNFPGTLDNSFDVILRRFERIEEIHPLVFTLILILIALIGGRGRWIFSLVFLLFLASDWLSLSLLPHFGKSFGPAKPPSLILAVARLPFALLPETAALIFQAIGSVMVMYGFWIEPHQLRLTRQSLHSGKLHKNTRFTLMHLGDYHLERITGRERRLNRMIRELKPDLILFSGDALNLSFNADPEAIAQAREMMSEWKAPLGCYAVSGSEAVDLQEVFPKLLEDLPMRRLEAENVLIKVGRDKIRLSGLSCTHRPFLDTPILENLSGQHDNLFSILLYHSPDLAPNACRLGFDLQLSGHTHGGQICLPVFGPFFTASLYGRALRSGRYQMGMMTLYITRGIGLEGKAAPRVRFLCPPEVILWDIQGSRSD